MKIKIISALLLFVFISIHLKAQEISCNVYDTTSSALPDIVIKTIAADRDGNVWFATGDCFFGGILVRFDGATFTRYDSTVTPIKDKFITCLKLSPDGELYVGTKYSGLFVMQNKMWTQYSRENCAIGSNHITCIAFDKSGNPWIGTENGVATKSGNDWRVFQHGGSGIPGEAINGISVDGENRVWIATNEGYARLVNDSWEVFNTANSELPNNQVNDVFTDTDGSLWVVFWGGLLHISSERKIYTPENSGLPKYCDFKLFRDKRRVLWASTHSGLVRFDGKTWKIFTPMNSCLPSFFNNGITEDTRGRLWMATNDGLVVFSDK